MALNEKKTFLNEKENAPEEFDNIEERTSICNTSDFVYGAGDAVFTSLVVAPQVVSVWRGTWGVMNLNKVFFPFAQSFIMGIVLHMCFALIRSKLLSRSKGAWGEDGKAGRWLRERILSRIYTYIFILACIMHWRGGWGLFDTFVDTLLPHDNDPHRPVVIAGLTLLVYLSSTALRSSKNILASPYFLVTDGKEPTYIFTTRYQKTSSRETVLYILDCVFSVAVVGSLVVFVWRGSWALLDIYLYPDDPERSYWISVTVGYGIVLVTFALQSPMRWLVSQLQGASRLLLADIYHVVSFVATINVWRGLWGLLDIYLYPDSPEFSNWCSHIVSILLLILLNCSNSVLVRGVYIDADEPNGDCVVFPYHYLRLFFKRTKPAGSIVIVKGMDTRKEKEANVPLQSVIEEV